jgi:Ca2+-binding EF-hand superfamily protein
MGNFIKGSDLHPIDEIDKGNQEYPSIFPFNNEQVKTFCQEYQLNAKEVSQMHKIFSSIDVEFRGYITIDGFLELLQETDTSIVYPYLQGLFKLVKQSEPRQVDFFEWMAMVIDYCLMTGDQMAKFIFRVIDTNNDEIISKRDILKLFSQKNRGKRIFPLNYLKLIEVIDLDRSDSISKHEINKVISHVPFLMYPAIRLQHDMRKRIIGEAFWK